MLYKYSGCQCEWCCCCGWRRGNEKRDWFPAPFAQMTKLEDANLSPNRFLDKLSHPFLFRRRSYSSLLHSEGVLSIRQRKRFEGLPGVILFSLLIYTGWLRWRRTKSQQITRWLCKVSRFILKPENLIKNNNRSWKGGSGGRAKYTIRNGDFVYNTKQN